MKLTSFEKNSHFATIPYRHRVCNSEFPCEICKSWTSEKRQSVERMIDKARLAATKKQSRSTDVETCPSTSSPLTGTRQFVASSLLTRADNQNNQSLLTGTVTTQSPLTGTGAIQSPLVGTGTFQSNSPVGVGSVHDIHASNIDINARARTEMSLIHLCGCLICQINKTFGKIL